jgi:apolipoprotein D and lipocalin family protein
MAALVLASAVAGCAAPVSQTAAFRGASAPIYSAAALDTDRLEGRWVQAAGFSAPGRAGCAPGAVEFRRGASGLQVDGELCLNGRVQRVSGAVGQLGSGRLGVAGMEDWWVLWVDSGYRTLAVGTPSGAFGFVLDRGAVTADRLAAARELFDFNGYRAAALGPL